MPAGGAGPLQSAELPHSFMSYSRLFHASTQPLEASAIGIPAKRFLHRDCNCRPTGPRNFPAASASSQVIPLATVFSSVTCVLFVFSIPLILEGPGKMSSPPSSVIQPISYLSHVSAFARAVSVEVLESDSLGIHHCFTLYKPGQVEGGTLRTC